MPWRCPACHTEIVHRDHEDQPREGAVYRCSVCRLELSFDSRMGKLVPAPLPHATDRRTRRKQN